MKISVILIDGSFRDNLFGAQFFTQQDFPKDDYEVLWVEFYETANPKLDAYRANGLKIITLGHSPETTYHSSLCFNEGIKRAAGDIVVIPDADQIVGPDFLQKVLDWHSSDDRLVVYGYRYEEKVPQSIGNFDDLEEVQSLCYLKNVTNYGGCLTVRRKWLLDINGYEQHWFFATGFHANGTDIYHRLKNLNLKVVWDTNLRLYHPWHPFTQVPLNEKEHYQLQFRLIPWRARQLEVLPFEGIDPARNSTLDFPFDAAEIESIKASARPVEPPRGLKAGLAVAFPGLLKLFGRK